MRLKQKIALLLSGVMLAGAIGMINPVEVKAAPRPNAFTLTVPADTNIESSGWNNIGEVKVTGNIETSKKVTVAITTANGSKLISGSNVVSYTIKKSSDDSDALTSIDFAAADVNKSEGASQAIGAVVEDFSSAEVGTYEDTINFTATLKAGAITVNKAGGDLLSSDNLGTASAPFQSGSNWYVAYNGFISSTSGSSWQNAQDFVEALKSANYGGYDDWQLLGSEGMATAWYTSYSSVSRGSVSGLWSSVADPNIDSDAYFLYCNSGNWTVGEKSRADSAIGFVVLRGAPAAAPTAVTYTKAGGGTLSSANLGTATTWEYDGTTYEVYNGFIPSSSGSSWNDATGFISALNNANNGAGYNDHKDWKLFTSEAMAKAWYDQYVNGKSFERGVVDYLWSSVEPNNNNTYAFYRRCSTGSWNGIPKSQATADYGFVVLRGHSDV